MASSTSTTLKPSEGRLLVRGVRSSGRVGSLYLPDTTRHDSDMQFIVLASGKGCESQPGDRVVTAKHPGIPWQPDPTGEVLRIVSEEAECLARIVTEE